MRLTDFVMSRGPLSSGPNLRQSSGTLFTIPGAGLSSTAATGPSRRIIESGDADQSHTYAVGRASGKALDLFQRLRDTADHLISSLRPGLTTGEAFDLAQDRALEMGLEAAFMAFASQAKAHFVGHGIALELNEPPLLSRHGSTVLKAGMVLAIEMHVMEADGLALKPEDYGTPYRPRGSDTDPESARTSGAWPSGSHTLYHLTVLDSSCGSIAGCFASSILAELGAEVIRIEAPEGNPERTFSP